MILISALWRMRQVHICESKASLVYRVSLRTGLHREILARKTKQNKTAKYPTQNKTPKPEPKRERQRQREKGWSNCPGWGGLWGGFKL